ncbi:MAG: acetate--CoA ligase family protein [Actinomycetota bacterium]
MPSLVPLLEAQSVAIIGASNRPGSVGNVVVRQLAGGGFGGRIWPINPRHSEVEGLECLASVEEAGPVDLAVLAVPNHALEGQMEAAIDAGAGSVVIFASCLGTTASGETLVKRLAAMARTAEIPVCGGNGMGFVNLERQLRICGFRQPPDLAPGGVAFFTHSGSLFSALLHNGRGLRFNLAVSTGNELVTTMDEYVTDALRRPSTAVVGMFLEAIRNVPGMEAALAAASEADLPVVALKVGRTDEARRAVATHTSALAGDYDTFAAFAAAYGVHLVESMDEMTDTLELFSSRRRAAPGALAAVHDSGGERSLLIDIAHRTGVPLTRLADSTRQQLSGLLDPGLEAENPLDAWGTGRDANRIFTESLKVLAGDPGVGVLAFAVDLTTEDSPEDGYVKVPIEAAQLTAKPLVLLSNLGSAVDPDHAARIQVAGIPVLRGTDTGLRAIRHLFDHRDQRGLSPVAVGQPPAALADWRSRLRPGSMLDEHSSLRLIADFGIQTIPSYLIANLREAVSAAELSPYPVALKISGISHKSESGGVRLGIRNRQELEAAFIDLASLGRSMVVQPMAPAGIELSLGLIADRQYGPVIVIASGGVLVEVLQDKVTALAPLDLARAEAMINRLSIRRLLDGHRGRPAIHLQALLDAIVLFSSMSIHLAGSVASIDVNPLIAHPDGVVAVDALVVI